MVLPAWRWRHAHSVRHIHKSLQSPNGKSAATAACVLPFPDLRELHKGFSADSKPITREWTSLVLQAPLHSGCFHAEVDALQATGAV